MNRSSGRDGKRGTELGRDLDVAVPDHAIWSVIHTGLPPAAATIVFVTSPTTLMSRFALPVCAQSTRGLPRSAPATPEPGQEERELDLDGLVGRSAGTTKGEVEGSSDQGHDRGG